MSVTTVLTTPFDVDNEEGTPPRDLLPMGRYKAEISAATVGPTKNGKGQTVNLTWVIAEGEYEKRLIFQNILIQHESADAERIGRQVFKDVCSACGIVGQITDLDGLLYKPCVISVIIRHDKSGQYPDKNEVKRVSPVMNWNGPKSSTSAATLKEATSTPKAFEATGEALNDEIPF